MKRMLFVLSLLVVGVIQLLTFRLTIDDSYITFRFARNLIDNGALVLNVAESPVEGFSNLLWLLFMLPPIALGFDVVLYAKLLGMISAYLTICVLYRLTGHSYAGLMLAFMPPFAIHSITAMETSMYILLIAVLLWRSEREQPFWGLLLALCRIEGVVVIGVLILFNLTQKKFRLVLATFIPIATYHLWRLLYFGSFVSSVMAKKSVTGVEGVHIALLFLLALGPIVYVALSQLEEKPRTALLMFALFGVTTLFYPEQAYFFRFVFPAVIPMVILAAPRIKELIPPMTPKAAIKILPLVFLLVFPLAHVRGDIIISNGFQDKMESGYIPLAQDLAVYGNVTIALADTGVVGWYCKEARIIDIVGFFYSEILDDLDSADWLFSQSPDFIVLGSFERDKIPPDEELLLIRKQAIAIYEHDAFADYSLIQKYKVRDAHWLWLWGIV